MGDDFTVRESPRAVEATVRESPRAVEATERQTRGQTDWFHGVDVHHVFFEGIHPRDDGSCEIFWGS